MTTPPNKMLNASSAPWAAGRRGFHHDLEIEQAGTESAAALHVGHRQLCLWTWASVGALEAGSHQTSLAIRLATTLIIGQVSWDLTYGLKSVS
jgi:hypothetical protein